MGGDDDDVTDRKVYRCPRPDCPRQLTGTPHLRQHMMAEGILADRRELFEELARLQGYAQAFGTQGPAITLRDDLARLRTEWRNQ